MAFLSRLMMHAQCLDAGPPFAFVCVSFIISNTIICFTILMGADTSPHPKETNKQNIWCTAVFVFDNLVAHTLLGTVTQLFIPSSVHLYTDQPAGGLLWTEIV